MVGKPVERDWGALADFVDGGKRVRFSFGRGASYVAQLPDLSPAYYLPIHSDLSGPRIAAADGGRTVVTWGEDEIIAFTNAATGYSQGTCHEYGQKVLQVAASPVKDRAVALLSRSRNLEEKSSPLSLVRVDRREGAVPGELLSCTATASLGTLEIPFDPRLEISPDGTRAMMILHGRIRMFQVSDLKELASTAPPSAPQ